MINIFLVVIIAISLSDIVIVYIITYKIRQHLDYILREITDYDKYSNPTEDKYSNITEEKKEEVLVLYEFAIVNKSLDIKGMWIKGVHYVPVGKGKNGRFKKVS